MMYIERLSQFLFSDTTSLTSVVVPFTGKRGLDLPVLTPPFPMSPLPVVVIISSCYLSEAFKRAKNVVILVFLLSRFHRTTPHTYVLAANMARKCNPSMCRQTTSRAKFGVVFLKTMPSHLKRLIALNASHLYQRRRGIMQALIRAKAIYSIIIVKNLAACFAGMLFLPSLTKAFSRAISLSCPTRGIVGSTILTNFRFEFSLIHELIIQQEDR